MTSRRICCIRETVDPTIPEPYHLQRETGLSFIIGIMEKRVFIIISSVLLVLCAGLAAVNKDLYHFVYDTLCERTFSPGTDHTGNYLITEQIALKQGTYTLSPKMMVQGSGNGLYIADGNGEEIFFTELTDGMENPSFVFEIKDSSRQIRIGVRYNSPDSAIQTERIRISSDHVLYRDSLLRHAAISGLLILAAIWLVLRSCFPEIIWKLFPLFSRPENELALGFLLGITLIACYPLFSGKTYVRGEDMFFHLTRIKGLAESLRAGYFPVRNQLYWLHNYGYGVGFYYPDVFLYFPAAMVLLGFEPMSAYKVFLIVCSFFSVTSVWFAAFRISKSRPAACNAAVLMSFSAYRLSNIYYRGAVGETQAAIFLPLIILGLYEIFCENSGRWFWFACGFLGLLCSHMISLTIASAFTFLFLLTQIRRILTDRRIPAALIKSVLFVIGIGAFFWIPMLEQMATNPELRINQLIDSGAHLNTTNYAFPVQNIFSRFKTWNFAWQADCIYPGWPLLLIPILGILVWRKRDRTIKTADFMLAFSLLMLWMCTRAFPWTLKIFLPFVTRIQFAYRILLPASILLSLCGGIYFAMLSKGRCFPIWLRALVLFCFFTTAHPILQETILHRTVDKSLFVMQDNRVSGAEYLPKGLDNDFPIKNADTVFIPGGKPELTISAHNRQKLSFSFAYELPENSDDVNISVPLIYYTGFQGTITAEDGSVVRIPIRWDERGLVCINSSGINRGTVSVSYHKTPAQKFSECITMLFILAMIFYQKKHTYIQACRDIIHSGPADNR